MEACGFRGVTCRDLYSLLLPEGFSLSWPIVIWSCFNLPSRSIFYWRILYIVRFLLMTGLLRQVLFFLLDVLFVVMLWKMWSIYICRCSNSRDLWSMISVAFGVTLNLMVLFLNFVDRWKGFSFSSQIACLWSVAIVTCFLAIWAATNSARFKDMLQSVYASKLFVWKTNFKIGCMHNTILKLVPA